MDQTPQHDRPRAERRTEPPTEPRTTEPPGARRPGGRGMLWGLLAVVLAFLIGFFWQFYQATNVRTDLARVESELVVERLRSQLANSAIAAQAGDFERARRGMSQFFDRLQAERWALPMELERPATEFLAMRDDVITGLSRSNPEYAGVLFGMLDRFEEAIPTDLGQPRTGAAADPQDPGPR